MYLGAATVMLVRFDPVAVIKAVEKYSCTVWYSLALDEYRHTYQPAERKYLGERGQP
ncbi:MAG: hypothetical protein ACUVSK_01120 [Desulfotomaculales bacterium]